MKIPLQAQPVWAVNVGGDAFTSSDGTHYAADWPEIGGDLGSMEHVKGSQDPDLYRNFRAGDIRVDREIDNGIYDVTLHFAEPEHIHAHERIFSVYLNGEKRVHDLDIVRSRDGQVISALTVTVPRVRATERRLLIEFETALRYPLLYAIAVRKSIPRDDTWSLVWSDEFDGDELDQTHWRHNVWPPGKVNDEFQAYTDRLQNVRLVDGKLVIEAHREDYQGAHYTSGRVHTSGTQDFRYGRFEIRAKLPRGQGTWPAIWMLPSDPFAYATTCEEGADWQGSDSCDAWPNSGEIDIMEHVGYEMGHVHGTVHNKAYYWINWEQRKGRVLLDDADTAFHVYAMEWSKDRIDIFVDDTLYFTYVNEGTDWRSWPYDRPFHLIMNIAVGGAWGSAGGPVDDSVFPQQLLIDYVRVYQKKA